MSRIVVRFEKRKTSWERPDAASIREIEFRTREGAVDMRPSVYEIEDTDLKRAFSEHATAAKIDPPGSTLGLEFTGLPIKLERTDGSPHFEFIKTHHREIAIESIAHLDHLIDVIRHEREQRSRVVSKADVVTYASERLAANDTEWRTFAARDDAKSWLKKLAKKVSEAAAIKAAEQAAENDT